MSHGENGVTRPRLAHLESILQELSKHEQRSNLQSVEQTSVRTQQRLLKDQLRQAHEELAEAQGSKAKLCESIGALQQVKDEQEKEILLLKTELQTSRESQTALIKKMEGLETFTQHLKKNYIRSLSFRLKTASELLGRLQLANTYPIVQADVSGAEITAKCNVWIGSEPNKKKRFMDMDNVTAKQPTIMAKPAEKVSTIPVAADPEIEQIQVAEDGDVSMTAGSQEGHISSHTSSDAVGMQVIAQDVTMTSSSDIACCNCSEKIEISLEHKEDNVALQNEIEEVKSTLKSLEEKHKVAERDNAQLVKQASIASDALDEKDAVILELETQLSAAKSTAALEVTPTQSENVADLENRLKALEDNLSQMNNYADHLESIIGQCPSCSIKMQSEGADEMPCGDK